QAKRGDAKLDGRILRLRLGEPRVSREPLVRGASRELGRAERVDDLRVVGEQRLRCLRSSQRGAGIAQAPVITDQREPGTYRLRVRRDRLFDDGLGLLRIGTRHRRNVGEGKKYLLVLRVLLEHL